MAHLFASSGRLNGAATLYGFAETLGRQDAVRVSDASMTKRTKVIDNIRSHMDPNEFNCVWQAGEGMNLEEAVAFANAPVP